MLKTLEFEVRISKEGRSYRAVAFRSEKGDGHSEFEATGAEWVEFGGEVKPRTLCRKNRQVPTRLDELRSLGRTLFELVFRDQLFTVLDRHLMAVKEGNRLRLRFSFEGAATPCSNWPWEVLVDPSTNQFLALDPLISIERKPILAGIPPVPRLSHGQKLRVLVVGASPASLPTVGVEREAGWIRAALESAAVPVELEVHESAGQEAFSRALAGGIQEAKHDLIHFIGHGDFDGAEGGLWLEGENGQGTRLSSRDLPTFLRGAPPFVFLNICHGGRADQDPFAGMADALLRAGVAAVVAMRQEVADESAIAIARSFYDRIAQGDSLSLALSVARRAAKIETCDWAIPLLFLAGNDFELFSVRDSADLPAFPLSARIHGLRGVLDRYCPSLHDKLMDSRLLSSPAGLAEERKYLRSFQARMKNENQTGNIVPLDAGEVVGRGGGSEYRSPMHRAESVRTVRRVLRAITGISRGGDHTTAQLASASRKSRVVLDAVRELKRSPEPVVLLGDPGSGKSMILRQVGFEIAADGLQRAEPALPVYIRLGRFRVTEDNPTHSVARLIREELQAESPALAARFPELLVEGRLVVLFDGMDEMDRRNYEQQVKALSDFALQNSGTVKSLFACRINDFIPEFEHRQLVLTDLDRGQVREFLNLHLQFPVSLEGKKVHAKPVLRALERNVWTWEAARNPLLLFLICQFIQRQGELPRNRTELFADYVATLEVRAAQGVRVREVGRARQKVDMAEDWALFAFEVLRQGSGIYSDARLLIDSIGEFRARRAIEAGQRAGLLIEDPAAVGTVRFVHHRIQEYFAARYLLSLGSTFDWAPLLDLPRWQETLLNVVTLGGGESALAELQKRLNRLLEEGPGPQLRDPLEEAFRKNEQENLNADRVLLVSQILRETGKTTEGLPAGFTETFLAAVKLSADKGNPVTQVKMLWAGVNIPDLKLTELLATPRKSEVRWVRDQALTLMSSASRGVGIIADELALDLENEELIPRLSIYLKWLVTNPRASSWALFSVAVTLSLLSLGMQTLAAFGIFGFALVEFESDLFLGGKWFLQSVTLATIMALALTSRVRNFRSWDKIFGAVGLVWWLFAALSIAQYKSFLGALLLGIVLFFLVFLAGQFVGSACHGLVCLAFLVPHGLIERKKLWKLHDFGHRALERLLVPIVILASVLAIALAQYAIEQIGCLMILIPAALFVGTLTGLKSWLNSVFLAWAIAGLVTLSLVAAYIGQTESNQSRIVSFLEQVAIGFEFMIEILMALLVLPGMLLIVGMAVVFMVSLVVNMFSQLGWSRVLLLAALVSCFWALIHLVEKWLPLDSRIIEQQETRSLTGESSVVLVPLLFSAILIWVHLNKYWPKVIFFFKVVAVIGLYGMGSWLFVWLMESSDSGWLLLPLLGLLTLVMICLGLGYLLRLAQIKSKFPRDWQDAIRRGDSYQQEAILKALSQNLREVDPANLLCQLIELQDAVTEEPAISAYWSKRSDLQAILRQRRLEAGDEAGPQDPL